MLALLAVNRFVALSLLLVAMGSAAAGLSGGEGLVLVDRIVAVVDDDPILLSDVERVIALGLAVPGDGETAGQLRRRVLDGLIEQRLRLHEVDRYAIDPLPGPEIERQMELIRSRFPDPATLAQRLAELGLDEEGLRQLVARQLRILRYVEQRLGPRVFVELDEIRTYYETELAEELARRGTALPPIEEVREQIRSLLRERRLNEEIAAWTDQLRLEADVVDYFDRSDAELPPVVRRIDE